MKTLPAVMHAPFAVHEQGVVVGFLGNDPPALLRGQPAQRPRDRVAARVVAGMVSGQA